ncbi:13893_t:CDS:2 [Dentiscutata erythropus]|uniref:13893_t:CDS:1 n=1 Tax=Dentiscutata erythropus TaxID=1348616 RepID=A0A9N9CU16_9GLOM|nr:13893_t:CDS:2 [Dentiscutata erythropus]
MEPIYIQSDSDNTNTDNYKPTINYVSNENYESNDNESIYNGSDMEIPVANTTESNSYSPFDDYKVISTQHNNINSNYDDDSSITLIFESLRVEEIRYSALPIEYPPTSEQGIAIVFNVES